MRFLPSIGRRRKLPDHAVALGRIGDDATPEPENIPVAPSLDDEEPESPEQDGPPAAPASDAGSDAPTQPTEETEQHAAFDPLAPIELSGYCEDQRFLQRRHRLLAERWRWHDTPAERARLAAEYAHLCPNLESPWEWYLVRPVLLGGWRKSLPALLPALLAGPLTVLLYSWATGRASFLLLPLVVGILLGRLLHVGEFLTGLGNARRSGLLQSMVLTGRRVPEFADEISRSADFLVRDVWFAASATGALTIQVTGGLGFTDLILGAILLIVQIVRVVDRVLSRRRIARVAEILASPDSTPEQRAEVIDRLDVLRRFRDTSPGGASVRYATLLAAIQVSRYTYHQPRLLVGLLFFTWLPLSLLLIGAIGVVIFSTLSVLFGGTIAPQVMLPGSAHQTMLLIGSGVASMVIAIELEARALKRWIRTEDVLEDLGHWP